METNSQIYINMLCLLKYMYIYFKSFIIILELPHVLLIRFKPTNSIQKSHDNLVKHEISHVTSQ